MIEEAFDGFPVALSIFLPDYEPQFAKLLAASRSKGWKPIEGWVLVPREPTEEMLEAAWQRTRKATPEERMELLLGNNEAGFKVKAVNRYRAMIEAAPPHPFAGRWR